MRVLIAHKLWHVRGGVERYVINLRKMLIEHGHEAIPFTCAHESNEHTGYEAYYPPYRDVSKVKFDRDTLVTAANFFHSFEAARAVSRLLDVYRPDIVHCRNLYHHLSPSILAEFEKRDIPVLMTVADYKLVCPNYKLYRDGLVCDECKGGHYLNAVRHRCVKDSRMASALCAAEAAYHHATGAYVDRLDKILAPSEFTRGVLADHGLPEAKLGVLHHFVDSNEWHCPTSAEPGTPYLVCFGRLSAEKGIDVAIEAIALIGGVDLVIVGEGPDSAALHELADRIAPGRVRFVGFKAPDELREIIAGSLAVVMPSTWYEVFGFSIIESFALGKPVLGSRIGAIPELVVDGETGFTFTAGDPTALAERMQLLLDDPSRARLMGERARRLVEDEYSPETHYRQLISVYEELLR